ncbi:MAG TPA: gamma-glutamyl-gamma-aminobutyrate hydrolase family protein [Micavibrio sp.]|nr:gamma-glutamyl-gamma-aminobutyrate hydrolase family protein [Micavibrio sp.]
MPHALVIRHMYSGSLFTIEESFHEKGIDFSYAEGFATDISKIDALKPDIVVVLGGAMGVYEGHRYPWLADEIELIRKRVEADKPFLGICLGAQLMAASQGCDVYKGKAGREFGFLPVQVTKEGLQSPIHHFDESKTRVLQMHGDTFDLPQGATLLASSALYQNQAYRIGRNCFGVQFHPELNRIGLENTIVECHGHLDIQRLRKEADDYLSTMVTQTKLFLKNLYKIWDIV